MANLKEYIEQGLAQAEATKTRLVQVAGISRRTLSKILNEGHEPSPKTRGKIVHGIQKLLRESKVDDGQLRYPIEEKRDIGGVADQALKDVVPHLSDVERALLLSGTLLERNATWVPLYESLGPTDFPARSQQVKIEAKAVYSLPVEWTGGDSQAFILPVKGNELMGVSIHEGDLVVVAPNREVNSGDLAVIRKNDQLLMRRVIRRQSEVILEASHPDYTPISVPEGDPLEILGRIMCVVRLTKR